MFVAKGSIKKSGTYVAMESGTAGKTVPPKLGQLTQY